MRKIEILVDRDDLNELYDLFDLHGIIGYSVVDITEGRGAKRGSTLPQPFAGQHGVLVFSVCDVAQADALLGSLRAFLAAHKGFAFATPVDAVIV
ncbi:MAG: hypothetical protein R3B09_27320 [Nannocystaceae bacterium]